MLAETVDDDLSQPTYDQDTAAAAAVDADVDDDDGCWMCYEAPDHHDHSVMQNPRQQCWLAA